MVFKYVCCLFWIFWICHQDLAERNHYCSDPNPWENISHSLSIHARDHCQQVLHSIVNIPGHKYWGMYPRHIQTSHGARRERERVLVCFSHGKWVFKDNLCWDGAECETRWFSTEVPQRRETSHAVKVSWKNYSETIKQFPKLMNLFTEVYNGAGNSS